MSNTTENELNLTHYQTVHKPQTFYLLIISYLTLIKYYILVSSCEAATGLKDRVRNTNPENYQAGASTNTKTSSNLLRLLDFVVVRYYFVSLSLVRIKQDQVTGLPFEYWTTNLLLVLG
jgi:hypothetical protein